MKNKIGSIGMNNYRNLIEKNKFGFYTLKEKEIDNIFVQLGENDKIFVFYEKNDENENTRFNSFYYNHIFLEETPDFYEACFHNNKIFVNSQDFKMKSYFSLEGEKEHFIYLKLTLTFISELVIDEFDFELKKHDGFFIFLFFQ